MKAIKTGFVGLGNIGKPMALRLAADEAVDLQVFDLDRNPSTSWSRPVRLLLSRSGPWATGQTSSA